MTDLTDSYCERCGARYVFSPPAPKTVSLKGARVLMKGLKNYVMTDGQSMADSLSLARNEDSHEDSTRITEAFHRTFNFCMSCRQYACDKCWNSIAGACLTCAPQEGYEALPTEDHLLVRTPVARWDTDWSLFPDGPIVEPLARPATPQPFDPPIRFSEEEPGELIGAPPTTPEESAPPPYWPAVDLAEAAAQTPAADDRAARRPATRQVDPAAASLWPIADEIAPEMTLTPEELELVEDRLSHAEAQPEGAGAAVPGTEWIGAAPIEQAAPEPQPAATVEPEPLIVADALSSAGTASPSDGATRVHLPASEPQIVAAPEPASVTPPPVAPVARPIPPEPTPKPALAHLPTPAAGGAAPTGVWPRPTRWLERPVEIHDWWPGAEDAAVAAQEPEAQSPAVPQRSAEGFAAAPAPTSATPAAPLPETSAAAPAAALEQGFVVSSVREAAVDARSAAAMRVSAIPSQSPEPGSVPPAEVPSASLPAIFAGPAPAPVEQPEDETSPWLAAVHHQPLMPAAAPTQPDPQPQPQPVAQAAPPSQPQPAIQPELFDLPATPPSRPAPAADTFHRAATPWPQAGPSWPAAPDPAAAWPGPEVPSVLPAVAARQASSATVTAMWAQSSQEVLNRGTVRVCHRCALPVSTHARFCRRCGTPQT